MLKQIGRSDLQVAPVCLGGNTFGWTSDEKTSHEVLDDFVAAGGNFIDTADVYSAWAEGNSGGESEKIIGSWLAGRGKRDDVVIATKVAQHPQFRGLSASNVAAACDASLARLGTDYIDLYYAHEEDPAVPLEETVAAFGELVRAGKVRAIAVSNHSAETMRKWAEIAASTGVAAPVALQPHYNLVHRREFEAELRDTVVDLGLGVMPYWGLASGFLTGKYHSQAEITGDRAGMVEAYVNDRAWHVLDAVRDIAGAHGVEPAAVSLAWLRSQPTVVAPIASARVPAQLPALMASMTLQLTPDEIDTLDKLSDGLG